MSSSLLALASISAALAMGFVPAVLRGFGPHLQAHMQLPERGLNRLNTLLVLAWVPLMPLAGWAVDCWSAREVLFAGCLALAVAVAWLALCQTSRHLSLGLAALAVAGACITTAGVVMMPAGLSVAAAAGARRGGSALAALCLGFFFAGLASFLGPRLLAWVITKRDPRRSGLFLAAACLVPALLAAASSPPTVEPTPLHEASLLDVRFALVALAALLYFPLEHSLKIWPRPYLADLGYGERSGTRLLAGFWCAFLALRLAVAFQATFWRQDHEAWLVLCLVVGASMVLGNLAGAYAPGSGFLGLWFAGACYGPVLPALIATLELPGTRLIPGQAVGILFAISAASSLAVQPLIAAFATRHAPRETLRITMLLGLGVAAPLLVLAVTRAGR